MRAIITAAAHYLPDKILDNKAFESMVDTTNDWIVARTGIKERRMVAKNQATSDMAAIVGKQLLEKTGTRPEEVDVIVLATVTPDHVVPSAAALIQAKIGAKNAWGFDLNGACSGFLYALEVGAKLASSGSYRKVMVLGTDTMSSIVDYQDRNTCVLFGDGAGGVLLEPSDDTQSGILDSLLHTDGTGGSSLIIPAGGSREPASQETVAERRHYVRQDGKTVFKFAVKGMAQVSEEILARNNFSGNDVAMFIPHQANRRIIEAAAERCGISLDKTCLNIERFGNTTAATIPIGISEAWTEGRIKRGDLLLLAAFGAGFTWGSVLVRL